MLRDKPPGAHRGSASREEGPRAFVMQRPRSSASHSTPPPLEGYTLAMRELLSQIVVGPERQPVPRSPATAGGRRRISRISPPTHSPSSRPLDGRRAMPAAPTTRSPSSSSLDGRRAMTAVRLSHSSSADMGFYVWETIPPMPNAFGRTPGIHPGRPLNSVAPPRGDMHPRSPSLTWQPKLF